VKVKTRYGEFSAFTEGDLISRSLLRYGEWAQCEIEILRQFISKGDAVVDAGAYIGTHTVAFSLMVGRRGRIHSFEPNRRAKDLLVENVLANSPSNVTIYESALGDTPSKGRIETVGTQNLGATRIQSLGKPTNNSLAIKTLDSFRLKKLEFVKADVEGSEMLILRGATATIASFRPTVFLECNSLQAILELPPWLRQNEYISYGVLVGAFNPHNFNESKENIFGQSKECGLLLIPKERSSSLSIVIQRLNLPLIATTDDAALLLLHKPQYAYEILEKSISARALGISYPSPALGEVTNEYEIRVHDLNSQVVDLRGQLNSVTQSLERNYAATIADQEVKAERKIQAMTVQVDSLTKTIQSLQQEMLLQKASFYKKAHETNQAHVALEKELQEDLLLTEQEIRTVQDDLAATMADRQAEADLKVQAMKMQVDALTQTNQSLQQEILSGKTSFYREVQETNQTHAAIERELRENLLSRQTEIGALQRDWAAKMADRQAEAQLKAEALVLQVDSLTQAIQTLQQETLLQRASFYKKAHETNQAHVALERELQEELLSTQREFEALDRGWAAKMADQQVEAEQTLAVMAKHVDALTQSLLQAKEQERRQEAAYSEMEVGAHKARAELAEQMRELKLSTQRENEALERTWIAKMASQQVDAEQTLAVLTKQVDALTQSLLQSKKKQRRREVEYSEMARGANKAQAQLAEGLRELELSTQSEFDALERTWAAKMADQQAESEQNLQEMARQVDALTQALLVAEQEQQREQISYSKRASETDRAHFGVEMELRKSLRIERMEVERLQLATADLEIEKARVAASPIWRASERARKIASKLRGHFVQPKAISVTTPSLLRDTKESIPYDALIAHKMNHSEDAAIDEVCDTEMRETLQSGLFDQEYYLSTYADVRSANVDPLFHFVSYGWKEGRNPSESFDTKFYLDTYPDVKEANVNPVTHYVRFGKSEERQKASIELLSDISIFFDLFDQTRHVPKLVGTLAIDIIIPIYNGFDYLEPLFRSLLSHTSIPYRLIVVEDASPDIRVRSFLRELLRASADTNILLIENAENLGFVGSVNKAVAEVRNHFVLLNSDTEVPPNWLERLMFPILEMDKVASTTPFTNSGTICSFPHYLKDNPLFEDLRPEAIDSYFQFVKCENGYLPIPTGIGFCMGINKRVVDEIGMFDEIFGKGYCEENDWCARAEKLGYQNVQVPNLFVYHKHGGSFPSEERKRLIEKNHSILLEKHPSYDRRIQELISSNSLKDLRQCLVMLLSSNKAGAILMFDNEFCGGAHQFRKERVRRIIKDGDAVFVISYKRNKEKITTLEFHFKAYNFSYSVGEPDDLVKLFRALKVREIVINSFVSFPNVKDWIALTMRIRGGRDCRLVFLMHDYFSLCPSYTLVNDSNEYCGVPRDLSVCHECLIRSNGDFKRFEAHADILAWRTQWENFLQGCDEIVCFGGSSAEILRRAYPSIEMARIIVRPHDISGRFRQIYFESWRSTVKTIGVLGAVNLAKGSHVLRDLVEYIDTRRLAVKVILFGEIDVEINSPSFEVTGRYDIEHLEPIILAKNIDVFLLPSIWPETFSYTADEIMQMGFPLIVFNLGAPAERVRNYPLGKVIEVNDLYETLFGDEACIRAA
jgi:O-antigen biosynthesis protein